MTITILAPLRDFRVHAQEDLAFLANKFKTAESYNGQVQDVPYQKKANLFQAFIRVEISNEPDSD